MNKLGFFAGSTALCLGMLFAAPACAPEGPEVADDEDSAEQDDALRNGQFCGGIAGIPCPDGQQCVDDPRDSCDPAKGGADCSGVCRNAPGGGGGGGKKCNAAGRTYVSRDPAQCAAILFLCAEGTTPFFDDCGCGCETATTTPCGTSTCGSGMVCCNSSCGICTAPGDFCTQQVCESI